MKYKALMLDVDGTVVPYDYNVLPSDKLTRAITTAQEKISVSFVTGRSYPFLKPVLKKLNISRGYAVVNNGAHVIDLKDDNILYEQQINPKDIKEIINLLAKEKITFYIKQDLYHADYIEHPYKKGDSINTASMIFADDIHSSETIEDIRKKLSYLKDINIYKSMHKNGFGLNIQHLMATKLHGVEIILKELGVKSEEVIGVGDSYNDFPLLMACGLKVAMGNAVDELKEIADYIAPSVDEDGVVDVIEKFVLNK